MKTSLKYLVAATFLSLTISAFADVTVPMALTADVGTGPSIGTIVISETPYGLLFTPHLHDLTPGIHGFHIHQHPLCGQKGMAAGGHFDPHNTGKHLGPYNDKGHLGDLPALTVNTDGTATLPVLAPRLHHIDDIKNHVLMIHAGGDNYSDLPEKLGGGGSRSACGIIK